MKAVPLRIGEGGVVHAEIERAVASNGLKGGFITGIGGLSEADIGFYNPATREYAREHLEAGGEVIEVASLQGNYLITADGSVSVHLHIVAGLKGRVVAGHLLHGVVKPFLEVFLVETGGEVSEVFTHRAGRIR
ncbi:PPC domain-containing DNA-binding protein [Desulfurococcus mucosus]|uniref:PPC domain-containing protein n=1 Tax=Desulfurococcus mucosus (strain ATCC 35584 / DSM 2162 / JCM 9187 / O7/1) TaxID=765177 RepID=E8R872_DESM0|nr:DUF296 domain-containing protein [Desulfurococcus mucosus]ADV64698.1 protein of unknown function DUF296 [Desulfurococcus mucosus DSM 2162]